MNEQHINVPSGREYIIREQTGADDEILTSFASTNKSETELVNRFLTSIITAKVEGDKQTPVTLADVKAMPLRDRYVALIKSRIFSLGKELKFEYDFGSPFGKEAFIEDLSEYVWDYIIQPFPKRGDFDFSEQRVAPYDSDPYEKHLGNLSSGKKFRFGFMNGTSEEAMVKFNQINPHLNQELIARGLETPNASGEWVPVLNFGVFTAREMSEIRAKIKSVDPRFDLLTTLEHPSTGENIQIPILSLPDFFFPSLL